MLSLIVTSNAKKSSSIHADIAEANKPFVAIDTPEDPDSPFILPYNFTDQSTGDPLNYPNSTLR